MLRVRRITKIYFLALLLLISHEASGRTSFSSWCRRIFVEISQVEFFSRYIRPMKLDHHVFNQCSNACWANASIRSVELTQTAITHKKAEPLSVDFVLVLRILRDLDDPSGPNKIDSAGATFGQIASLMEEGGVLPEKKWPFRTTFLEWHWDYIAGQLQHLKAQNLSRERYAEAGSNLIERVVGVPGFIEKMRRLARESAINIGTYLHGSTVLDAVEVAPTEVRKNLIDLLNRTRKPVQILYRHEPAQYDGRTYHAQPLPTSQQGGGVSFLHFGVVVGYNAKGVLLLGSWGDRTGNEGYQHMSYEYLEQHLQALGLWVASPN